MSRQRSSNNPEPELLTSQDEIEALCRQVHEQGTFAFDTEFVMEDRYASEVCLVQVATRDRIALIDPFLDVELAPLWQLVCDPDVETVVHAGMEDLALAVRQTKAAPRNVFDLQIAAGLIGPDYPISLQRLVRAQLGVRLHKAKTLTDWRRRPLSDSQLVYGSEDVAHLLAVRDKLAHRLERRNRMDWAMEEMSRLEDITLYDREEEELLMRIKGVGSLEPQQLAVAHEVFRWRDKTAMRVNRPARTVVKDHLLVEIARHGLATTAEIRDLRGMNLSQRDMGELAKVVSAALRIPEEDWPKPRKMNVHETPEEQVMTTLVTAVLRSYCERNDVAYSLAATKRSIQALVRRESRGRDNTPSNGADLLSGWRADTVGQLADDILAGRRSMRVTQVKGKPVIKFSPRQEK